MSWTKREFIIAAFEEIGIGSYQYDIQPEMFDLARKRLDVMLSEWNALGIRMGYPVVNSPTSGDLDDNTELPDMANNAVILNLALNIAGVFGKSVPQMLFQRAQTAFNTLMTKNVDVPEMQYARTVPAGQGNKLRRTYSPFLLPPEDKLSDTDGDINLN